MSGLAKCVWIAELEVVERLAASIGFEVFEADVLRLAGLHALNPEATTQAIPVQVHTLRVPILQRHDATACDTKGGAKGS